jgi:8-oxo-dGTP pyrophosphatase MutT (NUDIX family)
MGKCQYLSYYSSILTLESLLYNPAMTATFVLNSPRSTRQGELRLGCSGVLLDQTRSRVLLTRRKDNGLWCLPGGSMEAGETVSEAIEREFLEETGIRVKTHSLTGVYSDPDQLIVYPDGSKVHAVVLNFLVNYVSGELTLSNETTDIHYFQIAEAINMELFHNHAEHLRDALSEQKSAFIK